MASEQSGSGKAITKIPLIWSNDDIFVGQHDQMARQLDFLDHFGIKGSFFVVPCMDGDKFLTDDPKLIAQLKQAMSAGHDVQQHSVTHVCIENGTADLRMFDLMGDQAKIDYSHNRFVWERLWQLDAIEAQISWGRRVWTEAFGSPSDGYRPGCGSFCANMYKALERLGFKWASSRLASMTGWMWQSGNYDYPIRLEGPVLPFGQGGLVEFPILDDVAFHIPREKIDDYVELGWKLWQLCLERNAPYHLVCHWHGLEHEGGTGYAVHEKLLPRILASGQAEPIVLSEYYDRLESGDLPLANAADIYPGPDKIPPWHALSRSASQSTQSDDASCHKDI